MFSGTAANLSHQEGVCIWRFSKGVRWTERRTVMNDSHNREKANNNRGLDRVSVEVNNCNDDARLTKPAQYIFSLFHRSNV